MEDFSKLYDEFFTKLDGFRKELQDFTQEFLLNPFTEHYKCSFIEGQDTSNNCYIQLASIHDAFYRLKKDAEAAYNVMDAVCEFAERSNDSGYNDD